MKTYAEFWPHYVRLHRNKQNRTLHFVGTTCVIVLVLLALSVGPWWLVSLTPVAGYGFAWVGHFYYEHSTPETWRHPLWSLRADFHMYRLIWVGSMDAEVARATHGRAHR